MELMAFEYDGWVWDLKLERGEMMFDGEEQMIIVLYSCFAFALLGYMLRIIDNLPFCTVRFYKPQKGSFPLEIVDN